MYLISVIYNSRSFRWEEQAWELPTRVSISRVTTSPIDTKWRRDRRGSRSHLRLDGVCASRFHLTTGLTSQGSPHRWVHRTVLCTMFSSLLFLQVTFMSTRYLVPQSLILSTMATSTRPPVSQLLYFQIPSLPRLSRPFSNLLKALLQAWILWMRAGVFR